MIYNLLFDLRFNDLRFTILFTIWLINRHILFKSRKGKQKISDGIVGGSSFNVF